MHLVQPKFYIDTIACQASCQILSSISPCKVGAVPLNSTLIARILTTDCSATPITPTTGDTGLSQQLSKLTLADAKQQVLNAPSAPVPGATVPELDALTQRYLNLDQNEQVQRLRELKAR